MTTRASLAMGATLCAILLSPALATTTVWRCGQTYGDTPCPQGRPLSVADQRTELETKAAERQVNRLQNLATRMREERLADERQALAANAKASSLGPAKKAAGPKPADRQKQVRAKQRQQLADEGTWPSVAQASRRKRD